MNQYTDRMAANALDQDGFGTSYTPPAQQHLVVETRTDDRWRVVMCTTLDDLDQAMDMARALRADPDIDEVCLTLETTGSHGREARREIIRFGHDGAPENFRVATGQPTAPAAQSPQMYAQAHQVSQASYEPVHPTNQSVGQSVDPDLNPLLQSIKAPDYEIDEAILDSLRPMPNSARPAVAPTHIPAAGPDEAEARAAARQLVQSLYGLSDDDNAAEAAPEPDDEPVRVLTREEVIDFSEIQQLSDDVKRRRALDVEREYVQEIEAAEAETDTPAPTDWVQGTDKSASHSGQRLEAEAEPKARMSAAERLERPLIGDPSGTATKAFIVAGTVAMMVLGGALAELLAVDLTTSAMAEQVPAYTDQQ